MTELVVADIGGTNARFAIAEIADGEVRTLGAPIKLRTAEYASVQTAWEAFADAAGRSLPRALSMAVASPGRRRRHQIHEQSLGDPTRPDSRAVGR